MKTRADIRSADIRSEVQAVARRLAARDAEVVAIGEAIFRGDRPPLFLVQPDRRPKMTSSLVSSWLRAYQANTVAAGMALEVFLRWAVGGEP